MMYGLPYKGSKNSIARQIVEALPAGERLVDLFAGGCAITHAALESGRWNAYHINDITDIPQMFLDAICGKFRDETRWISREDFFALKDTDPYVRQCWSYGNDGKSYIYSWELEPYKEAIHRTIFAETRRERYHGYRCAVRELVRLLRERPETSLLNLQNLNSLQSLERLQSLESLEGLGRLTVSQLDYRDVDLRDGDIVYCDIPYRDTGAEYVRGFSHEHFYAWALTVRQPLIISEYRMPEGDFIPVWSTTRCGHLGDNNNYVQETLFVPRGNPALELMRQPQISMQELIEGVG